MHVFSVCKDARVKQSMIASSKISLSESGIRRIDNHENYTQSQCAQYSVVKKRAHSDCQFVESRSQCTRSSNWRSCLFNTRVYGEN